MTPNVIWIAYFNFYADINVRANQWFLANQIFKWVDGTHDGAEKERKIETKYEEFF